MTCLAHPACVSPSSTIMLRCSQSATMRSSSERAFARSIVHSTKRHGCRSLPATASSHTAQRTCARRALLLRRQKWSIMQVMCVSCCRIRCISRWSGGWSTIGCLCRCVRAMRGSRSTCIRSSWSQASNPRPGRPCRRWLAGRPRRGILVLGAIPCPCRNSRASTCCPLLERCAVVWGRRPRRRWS